MIPENVHIPDNEFYRELKSFIDRMRNVPGPLIQVLHRAQKIFGYLPEEVLVFISRELAIPLAKIYGVVTFYNFFRTKPVGKHIINVCLGTACHVRGAEKLIKALEEDLQIGVGDTTADRIFTLSAARCFGACGLAPAVMIDDEVHGRQTPQSIKKIIKEIRKEELNK